MSNEKTFTIVGTAINSDGTPKVRWANDLVSRIKILDKAGCTEIDIRETPEPMTKLDALKWYSEQGDINPECQEIVDAKLAEKGKVKTRAEAKVSLEGKIEDAVTTKDTDPKVAEFIEKTLVN